MRPRSNVRLRSHLSGHGSRVGLWCLVGIALLMLAASPSVRASGNHQGWKTTSDVGVAVLVIASLGAPATHGDWQGFREAVYSDALGEGIALLGKSVIREERPNHRDHNSFPSGHTTLAFAAATTMYRRYGWRYGVPAYTIATLTGVARVAAREHHWWDAVAGAAFGIGAGWLVTHPFNEDVRMVPWASAHGGGIVVAMRW